MKSQSSFPLLPALALALAATPAIQAIPSDAVPSVIVDTAAEPIAEGKFKPTWESLKQFEVPEWFRDAKFGIWAHWGPQCQPGQGDWYARHMYLEDGPPWGSNVTAFHRETYGHPSQAGFKDVIHAWKAENWNPDKLMALYKRAGAQYFFALANHHDNLDLWDSKYQPWNSTRVGPKKNLIAGWEKAARKQGLKFGVSVHAAHAWSWYEPAQGADKKGPLAGVPYDGKLTKADGAGQWWEGLDPQDLYEQRHTPSPDFDQPKLLHDRWDWNNGVTLPDQAYCDRFYNRTMDLINKYQPDLIYFDDTALPLWPVSDAGLKIAAHFYNRGLATRGDNGVIFGKILEPDQRESLVWDIERGRIQDIDTVPWQTDTCIGDWHYNKKVLDRNGYKNARTVLHALIDIVSKNGNLLLSIPLRGDGTPDAASIAIVEDIAAWMEVNQQAIHGSRPWSVFGEGPRVANLKAMTAQGFNETQTSAFTAEDIRFTTKKDALYAFVLGKPSDTIKIASLGRTQGKAQGAVESVTLLGSNEHVSWTEGDDALTIAPPKQAPNDIALVYKFTFRKS